MTLLYKSKHVSKNFILLINAMILTSSKENSKNSTVRDEELLNECVNWDTAGFSTIGERNPMSLHTPLPARKNNLMFDEQQCSALLSVTKNLRNVK
jgi:hypothetical protein